MTGQRWMDKLDLMRTFLPRRGVGAELGVFEGHWASAFLREVCPTRMHLVDPWRHQDNAIYTSWANSDDVAQGARHDAVLKRFAARIACGQVVIHRGLAKDVAGDFDDESLDWISHDANHSRRAVLADLLDYAPKLVHRGLFLVDDYSPHEDENQYGVIGGVADFLRQQAGFELLGWSGGPSWTAVLLKE